MWKGVTGKHFLETLVHSDGLEIVLGPRGGLGFGSNWQERGGQMLGNQYVEDGGCPLPFHSRERGAGVVRKNP